MLIDGGDALERNKCPEKYFNEKYFNRTDFVDCGC